MPITYKVEYAMTRELVTVDADTKIRDAIKIMVKKDIGSIIVSKEGKPQGIVTERDITKRTCTIDDLCSMPVGELMSAPLMTVDADTPLGKAAEIMNEKNIRRLLITEKGNIVGIVTQKDLMRATLEVFRTLLQVGSLM
ncbi:CBS domain-containing protein [[Eubacterium] cellulosolvens]